MGGDEEEGLERPDDQGRSKRHRAFVENGLVEANRKLARIERKVDEIKGTLKFAFMIGVALAAAYVVRDLWLWWFK